MYKAANTLKFRLLLIWRPTKKKYRYAVPCCSTKPNPRTDSMPFPRANYWKKDG